MTHSPAGNHDKMRRSIRLLAATLAAAALALAAAAGTATAQDPATSTIATGLHVPVGDRVPARRRRARVRAHDRADPADPAGGGAPRARHARARASTRNAGEGGLLGLAVSPSYARDRLVYAYFTTAPDNRIVRFRLGGAAAARSSPASRRGVIHNGGRIAFGPDGKLYAGVGDAGNTGLAQNRSSRNGKILRMNPDGSVPPATRSRARASGRCGHRNVQGLAWDRSGPAVGDRVRPEHASTRST